MPQSLFEISEDMQALDDLLFELGGDVSDPKSEEAVASWMKELADKLHEKADGYGGLICLMEARAVARKQEANRLYRRADIDESSARFLKEKLKGVMELRGIKKLETMRFKISVAGNGGKVPLNLYDESLVPVGYLVPQPPKIDRDVLREGLERGEIIPGVEFGKVGTHLRIR